MKREGIGVDDFVDDEFFGDRFREGREIYGFMVRNAQHRRGEWDPKNAKGPLDTEVIDTNLANSLGINFLDLRQRYPNRADLVREVAFGENDDRWTADAVSVETVHLFFEAENDGHNGNGDFSDPRTYVGSGRTSIVGDALRVIHGTAHNDNGSGEVAKKRKEPKRARVEGLVEIAYDAFEKLGIRHPERLAKLEEGGYAVRDNGTLYIDEVRAREVLGPDNFGPFLAYARGLTNLDDLVEADSKAQKESATIEDSNGSNELIGPDILYLGIKKRDTGLDKRAWTKLINERGVVFNGGFSCLRNYNIPREVAKRYLEEGVIEELDRLFLGREEAIEQIKKTGGERKAKSKKEKPDKERISDEFKEISGLDEELLSHEEEIEIAQEIRTKRIEYLGLMFETRPGVRYIIELLGEKIEKKSAIRDIIEVRDKDIAGKKESLAKVIERVKGLGQEIDKEIQKLDPNTEISKQKSVVGEIDQRRESISNILSTNLVLRTNIEADLEETITSAYKEMLGEDEIDFFREIGETQGRFQSRLIEIKSARDAYIEAKKKLATPNLRLVFSISKGYWSSSHDKGDLFTMGCEGLMRAVNRFNPDLGYQFSTVATHWIRADISKGLEKESREVRLPREVHSANNKIRGEVNKLGSELSRDVTDEDLLERGFTQDQILIWRRSKRSDSLDQRHEPIKKDGGGMNRYDFMESKALGPAEEAIASDREELLERAMRSCLTEREISILKMRYGIDDSKAMTLQEVGDKIRLTRERVRQIEKKAKETLKAHIEIRYPGLTE